jgi:protein-S-isoprenylcysteine O-methyltransferase Ste14
VCVGIRSLLHVRSTGGSPFRNGPVGHGALAVAGFAAPFAVAAILDLRGGDDRLLHGGWAAAGGLVLAVAGVVGTMWAQLWMGDSWRIGVDPSERTALVTGGPYGRVRNPIYTAMFAFAAGVTLLLPTVLTLAGLVAVVVVIDLVVRRVEEPYLRATHGDAFTRWAAATGRFVPGIGHVTIPGR